MSKDTMEFATKIKDELIKRGIFEESEIDIQELVKNNDTKLTGLLMSVGDEVNQVAYVDFLMGQSIEDICDLIEQAKDDPTVSYARDLAKQSKNYDWVKDKVFPRLVNKSNNSEYLKDKVYSDFLDMAVVYAINVFESSLVVTKNLFEEWQVTLEELDAAARQNFERDSQNVTITKMNDILKELLPDTSEKELLGGRNNMYVVTTRNVINGSAAILFDDVLDRIEYVIGSSDYYILPSSIHEVIILNNNSITPADLRKIVTDINVSVVATNEILSDNVYRYVKGKGVEIAT